MTVDMKCSMNNIDEIKDDFNKVIQYSQNLNHTETNTLFEKWYEAKKKFIEVWDNKLIYRSSKKISFELSQQDRRDRLNNFINMVNDSGYEELAEFIEVQGDEGFFQNKVIDYYGYSEIIEGMKLLKSFKYFIEDPIALKEMQTTASMIIQENKVEGYLCFSVHPLDFISSSENTYNWRSCHALDGDYRAGNISYMMDKNTFMCYLCGTKLAKLPNFPEEVLWNNKKWRMLIYISDNWDCMFAGRQYPFFNRAILDTIKKELHKANIIELYSSYNGEDLWSNWHDDQITEINYREKEAPFQNYLYDIYIPLFHQLLPLQQVIQNAKYSYHYNDVLSSSCYKPYYTYQFRNSNIIPKFSIGGKVPCLCCGSRRLIVSDSMLCIDCELEFGNSHSDMFTTCSCCGRRIVAESAEYVYTTGELLCSDCYNKDATVCPICNNLVNNIDLKHDYQKDIDICYHCYRSSINTSTSFKKLDVNDFNAILGSFSFGLEDIISEGRYS